MLISALCWLGAVLAVALKFTGWCAGVFCLVAILAGWIPFRPPCRCSRVNELDKSCSAWCGESCIDGSCPRANSEIRAERCYPLILSCSECWEERSCKACIFQGSRDCPSYGLPF